MKTKSFQNKSTTETTYYFVLVSTFIGTSIQTRCVCVGSMKSITEMFVQTGRFIFLRVGSVKFSTKSSHYKLSFIKVSFVHFSLNNSLILCTSSNCSTPPFCSSQVRQPAVKCKHDARVCRSWSVCRTTKLPTTAATTHKHHVSLPSSVRVRSLGGSRSTEHKNPQKSTGYKG